MGTTLIWRSERFVEHEPCVVDYRQQIEAAAFASLKVEGDTNGRLSSRDVITTSMGCERRTWEEATERTELALGNTVRSEDKFIRSVTNSNPMSPDCHSSAFSRSVRQAADLATEALSLLDPSSDEHKLSRDYFTAAIHDWNLAIESALSGPPAGETRITGRCW